MSEQQKASGLRRQITLSMMALAFSVVLLVICGSYVFYAAVLTYSPNSVSDDLLPAPAELTWMAATMLAALALATWVAVKLAQRILTPLNSVADNLRRVAEGDLTARASADDGSMGEATRLVSDFNHLAERLQHMARDREFWNAAIAHELRTPVTVLRGRLQGLSEGVFQPTPQLISGLLTQVEGLSRLVEDLRLLELGESGRLTVHLQECNLADEIRAAVNPFEPTLRSAGFSPVLELADIEVICDPVRMRQALLALLDNAIQHATPGPLHIRTFERDGLAHLQVEDIGPGIPSEIGERVFEAFYCAEAVRSGQGSGLGLAVVKAIARAHKVEVSCKASDAGGTVFELVWRA
ncbi:HAMP domain-containing histidine kinase [Rhodospirillaceae bacterium KN72]|uniref:histidine kinase n=1 Tax=Pacificispira spongiicola TaxID=2729598 RepID=A0A7Y0DXV9_9PROT|nr:ATP-binding protein [Pacificispira spongiicola]NMM43617.1 HAMP domain-containing histidine kinase [Pacificispira spongiicola]